MKSKYNNLVFWGMIGLFTSLIFAGVAMAHGMTWYMISFALMAIAFSIIHYKYLEMELTEEVIDRYDLL